MLVTNQVHVHLLLLCLTCALSWSYYLLLLHPSPLANPPLPLRRPAIPLSLHPLPIPLRRILLLRLPTIYPPPLLLLSPPQHCLPVIIIVFDRVPLHYRPKHPFLLRPSRLLLAGLTPVLNQLIRSVRKSLVIVLLLFFESL